MGLPNPIGIKLILYMPTGIFVVAKFLTFFRHGFENIEHLIVNSLGIIRNLYRLLKIFYKLLVATINNKIMV